MKILQFSLYSVLTSLWFLIFAVWIKLSNFPKLELIKALDNLATSLQQIAGASLFLKLVVFLVVLTIHFIIFKALNIKKTEKLLIAVFSIMTALIIIIFAFKFLLIPIIDYNQGLLTSITRG